jgi:hypothetical protein
MWKREFQNAYDKDEFPDRIPYQSRSRNLSIIAESGHGDIANLGAGNGVSPSEGNDSWDKSQDDQSETSEREQRGTVDTTTEETMSRKKEREDGRMLFENIHCFRPLYYEYTSTTHEDFHHD